MNNEVAVAFCASIYRCCTVDEARGFIASTDEADCVTKMEALFTAATPAADKTTFDAAVAASCLSEMKGIACPVIGNFAAVVSSCNGVYIGLVANGETCASNDECVSKNCDTVTDAAAPVCATLPALGEACTENCVEGAYCDAVTNPASPVCAAQKADGEACTADECVNTCSNTKICETPAVCAAK